MDIASVISKNLSAWMDGSERLSTIKALSKSSGVGFGTVQRAKNGDGNITVQNLEAIARAFKRNATDLLIAPQGSQQAVAPITLEVAQEPPPDEREILQGYRAASPEVREIMLEAARRAIEKQNFSKRNETK